jgi:NADH-quinone oxidoreductase subunit D
MQDLPDQAMFQKLVKDLISEDLPRSLEDMEGLLNANRIFIDRTKGIGVLTHDEAIACSLTGPMARGSGVKRDLRKDAPYLCYADNWDNQGAAAVEFKVPIAMEGDAYSRYRVRVEEIKQSAHIIRQLIDNIPGGPVDAFADSKMVKPPKKDVYGSIEGLIQHFELIMSNRGWKAPIAETYGWNEGPNGEQGFYIVSDGGPRPWRVRTRPACFINYSAMARMTEGHLLSDVPAVIGSINVVAAELDR